MSGRVFGARVRRREDPRLVTGRGRYVADVALPGLVHVGVYRSPHAHARIVRVDAERARARPGVLRVLLPADVAGLPRLPVAVPHPSLTAPVSPELLPQHVVSYAGQPVALVVAETAAQAVDALDALAIDYEPLPAVACLDDALRTGGPCAHPGGNVAARYGQRVGDPAAAMAGADHVLRERFELHRGAGMALETRAIAARWDAELGQATVWSTSQTPQIQRRIIARYLGLPEHAVRVITQDIGGGFGPKGIVYVEDILVPLLARALGRPVRFVETRREHLLAVTQERDQRHDVELGLARDGRIVALRDTFVHDCGAFVSWGVIVPLITSVSVPGPYRVPNYEVTFTAVYTNRVPVTPVRGAGRPQAVFVMERMLDLAAARLGLDRVAIRQRNLIQPDEFPYDVGLLSRDDAPRRYDSGNYPECLRRAAEAIGYPGFAGERARAAAEGRALGIGFASFVEDTGLGPYEGVRVRVDPGGRVFVFVGASSQGQAHETTLAQVVADGLDVPLDQITVVPGDTAGINYGVGTFASRVAVLASASAGEAADKVRRRALAVAATRLEAAPEDLVLEAGRISVRGAPGRGLTLGEVAAVASTPRPGYVLPGGGEPGLEASAYVPVTQSTYSSGAHAAVVEVDRDTGAVRLVRYVAVDDCGTMINPTIVEGQIHGGIAHGVGNALLEEVVYDGGGQLLTGTLMDYALPRADDLPEFRVEHVVTPSPLNPLGVKGAGEGGTLPAPAAIANAIADAVDPLAVDVTAMPLTHERLWRRIRSAPHRGPMNLVEQHYGRGGILDSILGALRGAGKDIGALTPLDLAPVDQFHIRGREATVELADRAELRPGMRVLDVGSGLGGSVRYLASERGCRATGLDLTAEYVEAATALARLVGLADVVDFRQASALEIPFDAASFDVVWTEHVQMNIADKHRFYAELHRVLVPGGRLVFHDVFQGEGGAVHFPVPWADDGSVSFLAPPAAVRAMLAEVRFTVRSWIDKTEPSLAWFAAALERVKRAGPPPLGLHLLMGETAAVKFANIVRNLREARIVVVQVVAEKR